ncbi:Mitochondrial respiratory chain complexes assembly protein [Sphaceloma murrayae]|uniref:Mitochondrial respiratory chain complexes assembly protein n=1 Tax=Sphaceloma murrayae TaxID=2082308 RepID=A0A2K1QMF4_9PEZI|nr:Mitochondrial respiratory chain complexes assembly protein [Sphaceloma murrayae]
MAIVSSTSSVPDDGLLLVERTTAVSTGETVVHPFRIRPQIKLYMYCSECPCGDASMELVMSRQADATPWPSTGSAPSDDGTVQPMLGRGHFDQLGIVRRKPSRPDAPMTMSKSCSDKLAMKQVTSILCSLTSLLIAPDNAYLAALILPRDEYSETACRRAFGPSGRLAKSSSTPESGPAHYLRPFDVRTTDLRFPFGRDTSQSDETRYKPSNIAAVHFNGTTEVIVNGVLQGRKHTDLRCASALSRRRMWECAKSTAETLEMPDISKALASTTYKDLKGHGCLRTREAAKQRLIGESLQGWIRNDEDRAWSLSDG